LLTILIEGRWSHEKSSEKETGEKSSHADEEVLRQKKGVSITSPDVTTCKSGEPV
jgi:hypothetical protein